MKRNSPTLSRDSDDATSVSATTTKVIHAMLKPSVGNGHRSKQIEMDREAEHTLLYCTTVLDWDDIRTLE
jgi:hypothetical protein